MQLGGSAPEERQLGARDLTVWPSALGRWLVRWVLTVFGWASANVILAIALTTGAALVLSLTVASAEIYEAVDHGDGISRWDRPALDLALRHRTATNTHLVTLFTHLGGPLWMTVIASAVTLAMTVVWRRRTPLALMLIAVAGSLLMTNVGKQLVGRVRPPLSDAVPPYEFSASFPSGHALNSTVIAAMVAYLFLGRVSTVRTRLLTVVLAGCWAVAMGLSRVFLGHHWLTDVVFGWTLGLVWVGVVIFSHRLYLTVRRRRRTVRT